MARFTVLLDACVLVPVVLADTLLRIAERELYAPRWSARIVDEAIDAVLEIHSSVDPGRIRKRFADMDATFSDASVAGWERLLASVELPDPDDRHVVAAAIRGGAQVIVTRNTGDFPTEYLERFDLEVVTPDAFLLDNLDLAPRIVLDVISEQAAHTANPKLEVVDLVGRLALAGVPEFADEIRRRL